MSNFLEKKRNPTSQTATLICLLNINQFCVLRVYSSSDLQLKFVAMGLSSPDSSSRWGRWAERERERERYWETEMTLLNYFNFVWHPGRPWCSYVLLTCSTCLAWCLSGFNI